MFWWVDLVVWNIGDGKVFVVMLFYRPIQRLSDDCSINLNLSDHVHFFVGEKWRFLFAKKERIEHVLFVTTLNTNYRDTWRDTWSSSVLVKIFIIDGVAESVLLRTRPRFVDVVFRQTNRSQNGTIGVSRRYLKTLNACKIIDVKIAI